MPVGPSTLSEDRLPRARIQATTRLTPIPRTATTSTSAPSTGAGWMSRWIASTADDPADHQQRRAVARGGQDLGSLPAEGPGAASRPFGQPQGPSAAAMAPMSVSMCPASEKRADELATIAADDLDDQEGRQEHQGPVRWRRSPDAVTPCWCPPSACAVPICAPDRFAGCPSKGTSWPPPLTSPHHVSNAPARRVGEL